MRFWLIVVPRQVAFLSPQCSSHLRSTLSILLFGDLPIFVLGDVGLANLFSVLFALPVLASDPADFVSGGATLPSPDACDPVGMVVAVASAELAPVNDPGDN